MSKLFTCMKVWRKRSKRHGKRDHVIQADEDTEIDGIHEGSMLNESSTVKTDSGFHNEAAVVVMGQSGSVFGTHYNEECDAKQESNVLIDRAEMCSIAQVAPKGKVDILGTHYIEEYDEKLESDVLIGRAEMCSITPVGPKGKVDIFGKQDSNELFATAEMCSITPVVPKGKGNYLLLHPSQSKMDHPVVSAVDGPTQSISNGDDDSHTDVHTEEGHYIELDRPAVNGSVEIPAEAGSVSDGDLVFENDEQVSPGHTNLPPPLVRNTRTQQTQECNLPNTTRCPQGSVKDGNQVIENDGHLSMDHTNCPPSFVPNKSTQDNNLTNTTWAPGGPENGTLTYGDASTVALNTTDNNVDTDQTSSIATNQGFSKTCTSHAIAKALSGLFDIDSEKTACCLNQVHKDLNGTHPEEYDNRTIQVVKSNGEAGFILVFVNECKVEDIYNNYQFILTYEQGTHLYHSIYMKEKKETSFLCINSWGATQPVVEIPLDKVCKVYKIGGRWKDENSLLEPTIKMLSYKDIRDIAERLDFLSYNNWKDAGMKLCEKHGDESKLKKDEIQNLHLYYCGGGSPALQFLLRVSAKNPSYELSSFSKIAKDFSRNDIVLAISKWTENKKLLCDLEEDKLKSLACLLDKDIMVDWRDFADKLNFSHDDIKVLEESIKAGKKNSPSQQLLELISLKNPNFELRHLRNVLGDIGRNDVVAVLIPIINFHKNEMIASQNSSTGLP